MFILFTNNGGDWRHSVFIGTFDTKEAAKEYAEAYSIDDFVIFAQASCALAPFEWYKSYYNEEEKKPNRHVPWRCEKEAFMLPW